MYLTCPSCEASYRLPPEKRGSGTVTCPRCGAVFKTAAPGMGPDDSQIVPISDIEQSYEKTLPPDAMAMIQLWEDRSEEEDIDAAEARAREEAAQLKSVEPEVPEEDADLSEDTAVEAYVPVGGLHPSARSGEHRVVDGPVSTSSPPPVSARPAGPQASQNRRTATGGHEGISQEIGDPSDSGAITIPHAVTSSAPGKKPTAPSFYDADEDTQPPAISGGYVADPKTLAARLVEDSVGLQPKKKKKEEGGGIGLMTWVGIAVVVVVCGGGAAAATNVIAMAVSNTPTQTTQAAGAQPESIATARSITGPATRVPDPTPEPSIIVEPDPEDDPGSAPLANDADEEPTEDDPGADDEPEPEPEPVTRPRPRPRPKPRPRPRPRPRPAPEPVAAPTPGPVPAPEPGPAPAPNPVADPEPAGASRPAPNPEPERLDVNTSDLKNPFGG